MMSRIILQQEKDPELYESFKVFNQFEGAGIDASELRDVMSKFNFHISLEEAEDIIDSCDWDGDGELNFEEFCLIMMERD